MNNDLSQIRWTLCQLAPIEECPIYINVSVGFESLLSCEFIVRIAGHGCSEISPEVCLTGAHTVMCTSFVGSNCL